MTVLDDFTVNQLRNLLGRVLPWAVELKGLGRGPIFLQHALEGMANVDSLMK